MSNLNSSIQNRSTNDYEKRSYSDVGVVKHRILTITMIVAIVVVLGGLAYILTKPKSAETFTEFYLLNEAGKASGYPQSVTLGDSFNIIVGVVSHERESAIYRVQIVTDGVNDVWVDFGVLAQGEKLEKEVSIRPQVAGSKKKVEFYLYQSDKGQDKLFYAEPLLIYIEVVPPRN
jgi:uncharacterized membrane protein